MDELAVILLMFANLWRARNLAIADRRRPRSYWVHPIFQRERRRGVGEFHTLYHKLRRHGSKFIQYTRMSVAAFDLLLEKVSPYIRTRVAHGSAIRQTICTAERLIITLRFLSQGISFMTLSFIYRHGALTIRNIVLEGTQAIWLALKEEFCPVPNTAEKWKEVAAGFQEKWNLPHCLGAVDGKHIQIQAPPNTGSAFFNYKGTFSINLMAVSDARYRFLSVDVGESGRHSDGGVFGASEFGHALLNDRLPLPPDEPLPPIGPFPYYLVGDEAFPLKPNLMRPYPGRNLDEPKKIFNYRLSRGRHVIENAFGILVSRWRIFRQPIIALPDIAARYTLAAVALHNYLRSKEPSVYSPARLTDTENADGNIVEGEWRPTPSVLTPLPPSHSNRNSTAARVNRDTLAEYLTSAAGSLSWQLAHVRSTGSRAT